jgi:hypothetical protein
MIRAQRRAETNLAPRDERVSVAHRQTTDASPGTVPTI